MLKGSHRLSIIHMQDVLESPIDILEIDLKIYLKYRKANNF